MRAIAKIAMAAALLLGWVITPALAQDVAKDSYIGTRLVSDGELAFLSITTPNQALPDLGLANPGRYALSFSLPGAPETHFSFSPRVNAISPQYGAVNNRTYLGLNFGVNSETGLYGFLGVGSSFRNHSDLAISDLPRGPGAAPLLLHGGLEFGYHLTSDQSLSLNVDTVTASDTVDHGGPLGGFHLRYGLKF